QLRLAALQVVASGTRVLLREGFLPELKALFAGASVPEEILPRLIEEIEEFLEYDSDDANVRVTNSAGSDADVEDWLRSLTPENFHGQLVATVGREPWHFAARNAETTWHQEIERLARLLSLNPDLLSAEMPWLCSREARAAVLLGE